MLKTVFATTAMALALTAGSAMAHEWDTDDDGYVDVEEFRTGAGTDDLVAVYDTDDDGMLDADELNAMLFYIYDVDQDEQLSEDELTALTPIERDAVRSGFDKEQ